MEALARSFENKIINKNNESVDLSEHLKEKQYLLLYFSAYWCQICKKFTPKLIEFYNKHHEKKSFEIIFISSDSDEKYFKEDFVKMPWLAIKFDESKFRESIEQKIKAEEGIPLLMIYDKDGLVNPNARSYCSDDPNAEEFPWHY
jgi:nucleoredoxin